MTWTRAALALAAVVAVGLVAVSGGSSTDPRTPAARPGLPAPFLGTAVVGDGRLTAAVDAYGNVVDLRPGPAGPALVDNPADRQAAGTVDAETGIVPRVRIGDGPALPLWRADSVEQRYLEGTNVVRTVARFGAVRVVVTIAARGESLALDLVPSGERASEAVASFGVNADRAGWDLCLEDCRTLIRAAARGDREWLARARPLGASAPTWAVGMYERSLLTLRALTDARSGAAAAGARDGWAYVWPRDAGTAALAFAAAGYDGEARRIARFLLGLDLDAAARFLGNGTPVPGRGPQGDAAGWVAVAARAADLPPSSRAYTWRNRPDYQEGDPGTYLANALVGGGGGIGEEFGTPRGLVRRAGETASGLDSAAAWGVRPFSQPALYPAIRRTLLRLAAVRTRFGITPGEGWHGGSDPWTAPTAWSAWGLAALGKRAEALRLLTALRRAATPAGAFPERVDAQSGVPRSTTPLAWSHAFAVLALRELWPTRSGDLSSGFD